MVASRREPGKFNLVELNTYGVCPQKWLYRHKWGLRYYEQDPGEAYYQALRKALFRYVYSFVRDGPSHPWKSAIQILYHELQGAFNTGAMTYDKFWEARTDGLLALEDFQNRTIKQDGFRPISAGVPATVQIGVLSIEGEMDIVLSPPEAHRGVVAVCHITREKSKVSSPRFTPLEYGWTTAVAHDMFGDDAKVLHSTISPWHRSVLLPSPNYFSRSEFIGSVVGLSKGIQSNAVWQCASREQCRVCCYRKICSASHASPMTTDEIGKLNTAMAVPPKLGDE